ncbi:MAG: hypothetical protein ACRDL4_01235 [Thermoleophilaceae bacterium]
MVRWTGRLRFAEAPQVARRFGMDQRNAYRRLHGLVAHSLLEHRRIFHAEPGAYLATRAGLDAAGLQLPRPRVDVRTYRHDREVAWVLIALELEFGRTPILLERELRSRELRGAEWPRCAVWRGNQRTQRGLHFADLAVEIEDRRLLAIEVELTGKGRKRLDSIVAAYVRARHVATVRYYAAPAARRGVERAVARASAQGLFDIRTWEESYGVTDAGALAGA